jgi:hypothetical protein
MRGRSLPTACHKAARRGIDTNAFERAAAGFAGVIAAIVIGLGYLLPLIVLGLVGWFVVKPEARTPRSAEA